MDGWIYELMPGIKVTTSEVAQTTMDSEHARSRTHLNFSLDQ